MFKLIGGIFEFIFSIIEMVFDIVAGGVALLIDIVAGVLGAVFGVLGWLFSLITGLGVLGIIVALIFIVRRGSQGEKKAAPQPQGEKKYDVDDEEFVSFYDQYRK